jgi:hypothetical protein
MSDESPRPSSSTDEGRYVGLSEVIHNFNEGQHESKKGQPQIFDSAARSPRMTLFAGVKGIAL